MCLLIARDSRRSEQCISCVWDPRSSHGQQSKILFLYKPNMKVRLSMVPATCNHSMWGRNRKADSCEFKASLVDNVSIGHPSLQRIPVSKSLIRKKILKIDLLFQRNWLQFPTAIYWLTTTGNFSFRDSMQPSKTSYHANSWCTGRNTSKIPYMESK